MEEAKRTQAHSEAEGEVLRAVSRAILVVAAAATLAIPPGGAAAAPAQHFEQEVIGEELNCGERSYTVVAGVGHITFREGSSPSGNQSFSVTFTARQVVAEDGSGGRYDVRSTSHFGGMHNGTRGSGRFTGTVKVQLVGQGSGRVDNVNQVIHITTVNGSVKDFSFGSCHVDFEDGH